MFERFASHSQTLTFMGFPFSELSTIHKFLRALVMATYKNFNYNKMRPKLRVKDENLPRYKCLHGARHQMQERRRATSFEEFPSRSGPLSTLAYQRVSLQRNYTRGPASKLATGHYYTFLYAYIVEFKALAFVEGPVSQ